MAEAMKSETDVDENVRLRDELATELGVTHQRLAKALADLQEAVDTAMNIALRLDARETMHEQTQSELEEMRAQSLEQAETISKQKHYINGLRTQVRHPVRIVGKRVLAPFIRVARRDEAR